MKYSEVKHEDKFHEALSNAWERFGHYAAPAGIGACLILVVVVAWMIVSQQRMSSSEKPWAERFEIGRRYADVDPGDEEEQAKLFLAELDAFIQKHEGDAVAGITLLELARTHLGLAEFQRGKDKDDIVEDHLKRAAKAAEQFVADFPEHPQVPVAHYDAGKARLDLDQPEQAARHFEEAQKSDITFLVTLAQLQAGLCYEELGQVAKARAAFRAVRDDSKGSDGRRTWCADQAEYHLARLRRGPTKGS